MSEQHTLDESTKNALHKQANLREIQHKDKADETQRLNELKREGNSNVKASELADIKGSRLEVKTKNLHNELEPHLMKAANMRELQKSPIAASASELEHLKREGNPLVNKKEIQSLAKTENITTTTVE